MSPKRVAVFLLLMIGSPFWLLLRTGFGAYALALLAAAWAVAFGSVWLVAQDYWQEMPIEVVRAAKGVHAWLLMGAWMWAAQFGVWMFHGAALLLRERQARHPWFVGLLWLPGMCGAFMDIFATLAISVWGVVMMGDLSSAAVQPAQYAIMAMAGAFLGLAFICRMNGQILPMKPPMPRAGRKHPARYIARLPSRAKPSREGLAHIFSRRDPALRELTKS